MTAYTGYLTRMGHYSRPGDTAPGVNPEHVTPSPDPDLFNPQYQAVDGISGDVWNPTENGFQSGASVDAIAHWFRGNPSVPSNVPYGVAQQEMQNRMVQDHSVVHYVPDSIRLFQHATEGETINYESGRMPWQAGESVSENVGYLMNGTNAYDQTNQSNEVYQGDPVNVGRYRLGARYLMFGLYENPLGKFGLDTQLRAYTGLTPQFPAEKNQFTENAAPYTPNSSGTATWTLPTWQEPRLFSLPSETSITDYTTASEDSGSDFYEDGRL